MMVPLPDEGFATAEDTYDWDLVLASDAVDYAKRELPSRFIEITPVVRFKALHNKTKEILQNAVR
jgi:hypothetical protein